MSDKKPHLFIATPMYGGQCYGFYTQSILQLQTACKERGMDLSFSFMFNESLIQRARNALTLAFLKTNATHMMFIDADIRFNPMDIFPMIEADRDILCGIYPKKEINWLTVRNAMANNVPQDQLKHHTGAFVVNLVDYKPEITVPINQPVEIWNGGTGFMLIKREVLEGMKDKLPTYTNNVMDLSQQMKEDPITEYFATSIEAETNILLSEDYYFCKKAREQGYKVWAAPWAQLAHIGTYAFEGQLLQSP
jgi:hypothetical protein